jgi:hypothetical protein
MITVALVRNPDGRLDPSAVAVADGCATVYGCGPRLADPTMSAVAWVTGDGDGDQLGADLASVFAGSGAVVTVITEQVPAAAPPPPGSPS